MPKHKSTITRGDRVDVVELDQETLEPVANEAATDESEPKAAKPKSKSKKK